MKSKGVRGLYSGFSTTFTCSFVPSVIYFYAYEIMNEIGMKAINKVDNHLQKDSLKLMMPMATSALAYLTCVIPYMPFDIARARL